MALDGAGRVGLAKTNSREGCEKETEGSCGYSRGRWCYRAGRCVHEGC